MTTHIMTEVLSPEEIIRVMISEEELILTKIRKIVQGNEYKKFVKSTNKKTAYPVNIKNGCKLEYTVVLSNDLTNYTNNVFGYTTFATYMSSEGYQLIDYSKGTFESSEGKKINFRKFKLYTRHFFDRYRERILGNKSLDKKDVIKYFIRNHYGNSIEHQQTDLEGADEFCFPMSDCFGLGEKTFNDYCIVKSCIPFEWLKGNQKLIKEFCEQQLRKDEMLP